MIYERLVIYWMCINIKYLLVMAFLSMFLLTLYILVAILFFMINLDLQVLLLNLDLVFNENFSLDDYYLLSSNNMENNYTENSTQGGLSQEPGGPQPPVGYPEIVNSSDSKDTDRLAEMLEYEKANGKRYIRETGVKLSIPYTGDGEYNPWASRVARFARSVDPNAFYSTSVGNTSIDDVLIGKIRAINRDVPNSFR